MCVTITVSSDSPCLALSSPIDNSDNSKGGGGRERGGSGREEGGGAAAGGTQDTIKRLQLRSIINEHIYNIRA